MVINHENHVICGFSSWQNWINWILLPAYIGYFPPRDPPQWMDKLWWVPIANRFGGDHDLKDDDNPLMMKQIL